MIERTAHQEGSSMTVRAQFGVLRQRLYDYDIPEMARVAGVSKQSLYGIRNGKIKNPTLLMITTIEDTMERLKPQPKER